MNNDKEIKISPKDISQCLYSKYAFVYDSTNHQILLDIASTDRIYPASMTKLMTALLLAEYVTEWSGEIIITEEMIAGLVEAGAQRLDWASGAVVTMHDLLYAMMVISAADAAHAAAFVVAGSIDNFVKYMNKKATLLGLTNTHFTNPTGLHDIDHYSTPRDIALLLKACSDNDAVSTAMKTYSWKDISGTVFKNTWVTALEYSKQNVNGLLGGKTGFTEQGMYCFASFGKINDTEIICVTADAKPIYSNLIDASTIYNWLSTNQNYEKEEV